MAPWVRGLPRTSEDVRSSRRPHLRSHVWWHTSITLRPLDRRQRPESCQLAWGTQHSDRNKRDPASK